MKLFVVLLPRLVLSSSSLTSLSHKTSHFLPCHLFLSLPHDISLSLTYSYFVISSIRARRLTCTRQGPSDQHRLVRSQLRGSQPEALAARTMRVAKHRLPGIALPSLATPNVSLRSQQVPLDLLIVMVPSIRDESI